MRRAVEHYLEDPLAEALLSGDVKPGDTAKVICPEGEELLVFDSIKSKAEPDRAGGCKLRLVVSAQSTTDVINQKAESEGLRFFVRRHAEKPMRNGRSSFAV